MEHSPPSWRIHKGSGGDYYAPVTDLLLGVLFVFLILLTFFASQLQTSSEALTDTVRSRTQLLSKIQERLQAEGVAATIDTGEGVLSLSASEMFPQGSSDLTAEGRIIVAALANALHEELPCYAWNAAGPAISDCRNPYHSLSTVVIEGHTDSDPIRTTTWFQDNWDLSAGRASSTYRALISRHPELASLQNGYPGTASSQSLFSVAGFADERAVAAGDSPAAKARNRRIDIRFIMAPASRTRLVPLPAYEAPETAERPPVRLGRPLRFGAGLETSAYLADGWWPPESWGIWAESSEARLILPLAAQPGDGGLILELNGTGFVVEGAETRAYEVLLGDKLLDEFTLTHPNNSFTRRIEIQAALIPQDNVLVLTLHTDQLVSPESVNHSTDPRPLGLGLLGLELRRR